MATRELCNDVEFTYDWYQSLLEQLSCECRSFTEPPEDGTVHVRHDVDLSIDDALEMARIEAAAGITSTYCILLTSPIYNPLDTENAEKIREIESLGHDIGLHFDTHNYWDHDDPQPNDIIQERVHKEQEALELVTADLSPAVSFHRPPSWVLGREFNTFQSTYAPMFFSEIEYTADSSQRWREEPPSLPDIPTPAQLLTHPGLWAESDAEFDKRVERSVINACRDVNQRACEEFIDPQ